MIPTEAHLWYNLYEYGVPDETVLQAAANYRWLWMTASTDIMPGNVFSEAGVKDFGIHSRLAASLRQRNPNHRDGWYIGAPGLAMPQFLLWETITPDDCLHVPAPDLRPLIGYITSPAGIGLSKVINVSSRAVQDKIIAAILQFLYRYGYHGVLWDSFNPAWHGAMVVSGHALLNGCAEGPAHLTSWWEEHLGALAERTRWMLESHGFETMVNGIYPSLPGAPIDPWYGEHMVNASNYASAVMFEHTHRSYGDPVMAASTLAAISATARRRRRVMMNAIPELWRATSTEPQIANAANEQFYRAMAYLVNDPPYVSYGWHPQDPYMAWIKVPPGQPTTPYTHWEPQWTSLDLGTPLGSYRSETVPTGKPDGSVETLYRRTYTRAEILWNPSKTYLQAKLEPVLYRQWDPVSGGTLDYRNVAYPLANVPPTSGMVLFPVGA